MKHLIQSFNIAIAVCFSSFCFVTGSLVNSPGDNVAVHYSLLFFFFTIVLIILRTIARSVQQDVEGELRYYEVENADLHRKVKERDC